jgi:cytochrome P450
VKLLFAAGFDTTVGSITNAIRAFADNPNQWTLLKESPDLIDNAIEEVLRYYPPVRYTGRVAAMEAEVDGHIVPEGAPMMMMWLSGGRDPRFWHNPNDFDIRRDNVAGHMTFGVGIHACLGQHIARMETRAVLSAMLRHVDTLELAGQPEVSDNMQGFGFTKLPVRFASVPA